MYTIAVSPPVAADATAKLVLRCMPPDFPLAKRYPAPGGGLIAFVELTDAKGDRVNFGPMIVSGHHALPMWFDNEPAAGNQTPPQHTLDVDSSGWMDWMEFVDGEQVRGFFAQLLDHDKVTIKLVLEKGPATPYEACFDLRGLVNQIHPYEKFCGAIKHRKRAGRVPGPKPHRTAATLGAVDGAD